MATLLEIYRQNKEVGAVIVGVLLAFFLEWLVARRRRRGHFLALRAEMEYCHNLAKTYIDDMVAAPLYRLPTIAYANSFPALLAVAALKNDAKILIAFFNEVETLNRGLDQAEGARLITDSAERDAKLRDEFGRNRLKAERIASPESMSPTYYDHAKSVINSHLRWCRL